MEIEQAYAEFGLTPDATEAEVKAAWRRLVARWHPDRNDSPNALRKMQGLNRALEEIRRARVPDEAPAAEAGAPGDEPAGEDREAAGTGEAPAPGRTLHLTVPLTLEEAALGCVKELRGEVADDCPACEAAGFVVLDGGCRHCGGTGQFRQPAWFGWLSSLVECEACKGDGIARQPCAACEGRGKRPAREYRYRARIPAGVRDGDLLHVAGRPGRPADPDGGDLEIRIELLPHAFLELDADGTVRCEVPVDGFAWMAQRWVEVPTPAGLQQMKLNRTHLVYRLKGQGFPTERSGPRGDCRVTVVPLFPESLDGEQEALLDRLVATNSGDPGGPPGKRCSDWSRTLRAWQDGLPPQPQSRREGGS